MRLQNHHLELLSPARDAGIAREAILHGADAVYIGGPGFGARHNASNSLSDIAELVPFAPSLRCEDFCDAEYHPA
ncbi:Collagenase and related proteases [Raoultella terrigena]|uniref:Collagenase and related proteases n=1 Tax=Raoultella terrigena TaxID=577 RepID=A0A485BI18_RAOTE|nr:Collagenase and related proteases [Raoultella terrigena]